jgi:hypothetical protein
VKCFICEKPNETQGIGDYWTLNGFTIEGMKFWGYWCRDCFYTISQTPNHKVIDREKFNRTVAIYQLKR